MAFDLAIGTDEGVKFMDYGKAVELFKKVKLLHAVPLFVGPFEKAVAFNERFQSTIPKLLGLPVIDDNLAEGIVIKPMKEIIVTGKKGTALRPLLKKKIKEFNEDSRFHGAVNHDEDGSAPQGGAVFAFAMALVNWNRLESAISKIGALCPENLKAIIANCVDDVWEAVLSDEEMGVQVWELEESEQVAVLNNVRKAVTALANQHIKKK
eukprot:TRINITY_DN65457_c0_g2_i1.p1 TRINITY_DN65457_c0_g2~~TRINITY_DN65457_c0_g2_i1.p1  ORF type:complete len:209 (-),score=37.51 TRINITY_DN65457_c0_g2_i1:52-678(-)